MHIDVKEESIFGSMYKKLATGITYNEINWASRVRPKEKTLYFSVYTLMYI